MVIAINEESDLPIYMQIRNQIVIGISSGNLKAGEQLPTVRALASEIGINTMTVSKAYQLLKQEGFIISDRRNGARVRKDFSRVDGLSADNESQLQKIASEARIGGLEEEEFIEICRKFFKGEN